MKKEFSYKYDDLYAPVIEALKALGGSGTVSEIEDKIAGLLKLSDDELSDIHRGNRTKFSYRLAWTRNYLKRFGLLENLTRGVWALTPKSQALEKLSKKDINKQVRALYEREDKKATVVDGEIEEVQERPWQEDLLELVKELRPDQFERLCQRLLRLLGFIEVEVTGKSGDGGIDGKGILRLGGRHVLSCRVPSKTLRWQRFITDHPRFPRCNDGSGRQRHHHHDR